jgi:hypothetical protein
MVTSDDLDFDDDFLKNSSFNEGVLEWELIISLDGKECELDLLLDDELDLDLDDELDLDLDDELDDEESFPPRNESPFSSNEIENE